MANCTGKFTSSRTFQCHVHNQIRDNAHLLLSISLRHNLDMIRIAFRNLVFQFRVKAFQSIQLRSRGNLDLVLAIRGNDHDSIAIKVGTRQALSNLGIDANSILRVRTENALALGNLIVDLQNRNLERTTMRVTNQSHCLAIDVVRGIDFRILNRCQRKNNLVLLSRKSCCFQGNRCFITTISKIFKQLPLDSRIGQRAKLIELDLTVFLGEVQLTLNQCD